MNIFDAFELDVNVVNFLYYGKTQVMALDAGGWVEVIPHLRQKTGSDHIPRHQSIFLMRAATYFKNLWVDLLHIMDQGLKDKKCNIHT